jgi:hypothetical protein
MIEILPSEISRAIQWVGLDLVKGEVRPACALLAIRRGESGGARRLHGIWAGPGKDVALVGPALADLVMDGAGGSRPVDGKGAGPRRCAVCGGEASSRLLLSGVDAACAEHMADVWTRRLAPHAGKAAAPCPECGESWPVLWHEGGRDRCPRCLAAALLQGHPLRRWALLGGPPGPPESLADLRLFGEVWKRIFMCERCGSRGIRLRKIWAEFPRSSGPIYPLWASGRWDAAPEAEAHRRQQLLAYTQGLVRVILECPQCGYLERELPGWAP